MRFVFRLLVPTCAVCVCMWLEKSLNQLCGMWQGKLEISCCRTTVNLELECKQVTRDNAPLSQ